MELPCCHSLEQVPHAHMAFDSLQDTLQAEAHSQSVDSEGFRTHDDGVFDCWSLSSRQGA